MTKERAVRITVSWFLFATACLAVTQAPRSSYDPAQQGAPQKPRQGFVDFTLQRINPSNKDYGRCLEEAREIVLEETIRNGYFLSNAMTLGLLTCVFTIVVYQNRQRIRREWALAEVLQQYEHALTRANDQIDGATKRNHELMEALTAARESTPRLPVISVEQRATVSPQTSAKRPTGVQTVGAGTATTSVASVGAKASKENGNGIASANQMGSFRPDVDLILKVNSLEQQLERSQEQQKQLRRQLTQADQRLQAEQQKNRSLKGA